MKRLNALLNWNVISNDKLKLLFQSSAYVTAVVVFVACLSAIARFATSPFDVLIGLIGSSILAIGLITLGAIVPLAIGPHTVTDSTIQ